MDSDHARNHELQPRQPHAVIRQAAKLERQLRVGHVHRNFQRRLRHLVQRQVDHLDLELAHVHPADVALGAGDGDRFVMLECAGRLAAADHRRDAQLACHDRSMTGAPATVGDDGRGTLHHRLPVRIGHVGDQHVARLHHGHLAGIRHQADAAAADFLADGAAGNQHLGFFFQSIAAQHIHIAARLHRFGSRLQDVQLAIGAVLAPFDVHRATVMFLYGQRITPQFLRLGVGNTEALLLLCGSFQGTHRASGFVRLAEFHPDCLAAQVAADHRKLALLQRRFVNVKLVGIDRALHHGFAQAVGRGN